MSENDQELDVEIAGQKVRTKGYRLTDLIWLPLLFGVGYICLSLYQHEATAQTSTSSVVSALKESNAATVTAIKESNVNTVKALEALTAEQKKSTNAMKEIACLSDPAMKNRSDARDFCKRMSRDDR